MFKISYLMFPSLHNIKSSSFSQYWIRPKNDSIQNSIQNKIWNTHSKKVFNQTSSEHSIELFIHQKWGNLFNVPNWGQNMVWGSSSYKLSSLLWQIHATREAPKLSFFKSYCRHFNLCALSGLQLYTKIFSNWFQLSFTVTLTVRVIIRYEWGSKDKRANSDQIQLFALSTKVEQ